MKFFAFLSLLTSCNPFIYYPDSLIEESLEDIIFEKTDILVDLSGTTPEAA